MKVRKFVREFVDHINSVYESMVDPSVNWEDPSTIDVLEWNRIAAGDLLTFVVGPEHVKRKWHKTCLKLASDEPYDLVMKILREKDGKIGIDTI